MPLLIGLSNLNYAD